MEALPARQDPEVGRDRAKSYLSEEHVILADHGKVTALEAKLKAEGEYEGYRQRQDLEYISEFDRVVIAIVSAWLGHSDVNLTVMRYGRWSSEAREQWEWIRTLEKPVNAVAKGPWLRAAQRPQQPVGGCSSPQDMGPASSRGNYVAVS